MIDTKTKLCCVIGHPIQQSISPVVHNTLYARHGLNFVFLAFDITNVKSVLLGLKHMNVSGISVTIPHKQIVGQYLDEIDDVAKEIGAINTIVHRNGKYVGTNTDWIGAVSALKEKTPITGKRIALLGAGGAARAVSYALKRENAQIYVFNRTKDTALKLVDDFHLDGAYTLKDSQSIRECDIIINTTSVGMIPNSEVCPISTEAITNNHVVFDIINIPKKTKLLQMAIEKGATVVYGHRMLLYGSAKQFELFTNVKPDFLVMEKTLQTLFEKG